MLGRLRMDVKECLGRYLRMAQKVFGKWRLSLWGMGRNRYNAQPLRDEIEAIIDGNCTLPRNADDQRCRKMAAPEDLCKT